MASGAQMAAMIRRKYLTSQLMPREQRLALINRAFPVVVVHPKLTWGGVFMPMALPTEGHRVWHETAEDEEWCRNKWEEK
jgi:hypothetical protein